jgi:hypothetical protein
VIIPRGAENFVAIQLVSQYLTYLITRFFPRQDNNKEFTITFTANELVDPRYQFFQNKILVIDDDYQNELLKDIVEDFLNGRKLKYNKMFLDEHINSIVKLFSRHCHLKDYLIVTEVDSLTEAANSKSKKILYFKPFILNDKDLLQIEYILSNIGLSWIHSQIRRSRSSLSTSRLNLSNFL